MHSKPAASVSVTLAEPVHFAQIAAAAKGILHKQRMRGQRLPSQHDRGQPGKILNLRSRPSRLGWRRRMGVELALKLLTFLRNQNSCPYSCPYWWMGCVALKSISSVTSPRACSVGCQACEEIASHAVYVVTPTSS